jgi:hypothetical protein
MRSLHLVEALKRYDAGKRQSSKSDLLRICYEMLLVCYGKRLTLCESILTIQLACHWICGGTGKSEEEIGVEPPRRNPSDSADSPAILK